MEEDKIHKILEKYKEGKSTITEEQFLFNKAKDLEPSLKDWSTFVKKNQINTPTEFNSELWKSFENQKVGKRRKYTRTLLMAASVIIFITLFMAFPKDNNLNYAEKEALLKQAIRMTNISGIEQQRKTILYENEMIILYTTTKSNNSLNIN